MRQVSEHGPSLPNVCLNFVSDFLHAGSTIVRDSAIATIVGPAALHVGNPSNIGKLPSPIAIVMYNNPRDRSQPALHPCTLPCHAPSACPELEPCRAIVTLTCPCGRIRQFVPCGRSATNPSNRESTQQLKCSNECNIAKRNARLADALGINTENRQNGTVVYSDELVSFARVNPKLLGLVEKAFSE